MERDMLDLMEANAQLMLEACELARENLSLSEDVGELACQLDEWETEGVKLPKWFPRERMAKVLYVLDSDQEIRHLLFGRANDTVPIAALAYALEKSIKADDELGGC